MKKNLIFIITFLLVTFVYSQNSNTVQVLIPESVNLSTVDSVWLPGQIQDKLKENVQSYLNMTTIVDSKSETEVKKIQLQAESSGRDENTAIELGKLTTAKFALFSKIRKTPSGYSISVDYIDLTTGVQKASVSSKEYLQTSSLYGSTGAVDEITLKLAEKLGIKLGSLKENLLSTGSSSFSLDEQLELAKQNEVQFNKMMKEYDEELLKLSTSNDINAIQNKQKIAAEKALVQEKQNAEKKKQQELQEQKRRAEEDSKIDAERSIALKTQRDTLARQAAEKAAEVRKIKVEKQGVLDLITTIESKKKALVEIKHDVEKRCEELYAQMKNDEIEQALKILKMNWTGVELKDGNPTEVAKQRRANKVWANNDVLLLKFYDDCESVKNATLPQQNALLTDIKKDYATLTKIKTVSSLGDELKVSYGSFDSEKYGWNTYFSLYSDGILLYSGTFIINYEALVGKSAPNMEIATDVQLDEYANNVNMYNSLLARGNPILYFELDYNAIAADESKPSSYTFYFTKVRIINTITGKIVQTSNLNKELVRVMTPSQDLREVKGVVEEEKEKEKLVKEYSEKGYSRSDIDCVTQICNLSEKETIENFLKELSNKKITRKDINYALENFSFKLIDIVKANPMLFKDFIEIQNGNAFKRIDDLMVGKKIINKDLYEAVVGKKMLDGESKFYWIEALRFCNELSKLYNLEPVYSLEGETDVSKWNFKDRYNFYFQMQIKNTNGFRLLTIEKWKKWRLWQNWNTIKDLFSTSEEWTSSYEFTDSHEIRVKCITNNSDDEEYALRKLGSWWADEKFRIVRIIDN